MTDSMQSAVYEALAYMGPTLSAIYAGFAVIVLGVVYITPSGERYLAAH